MSKQLTLLLVLSSSIQLFGQQLSIVNLRCESKVNPMGIEKRTPALSWQLRSSQRNIFQTAFRILVADDSALLLKDQGNVWDSKKFDSDKSIEVSYGGRKLSPVQTYYWKVMVWDNKAHVSGWSAIAHWQMGLINTKDWENAEWIGYERILDSLVDILPVDSKKDHYIGNNVLPLMRKEFLVNREIEKATLFICGLGQFELSVNGERVGNHFLDPGWSKYDQQALYVPFDLTDRVRKGSNAIGVMLGNGFYYIPPVPGRYRKLKTAFGFPKMICRLAIEYKDGSLEEIISDSSWKTTQSPITFSSIYGGEDYDARLEQKHWDRPGFDDKNWRKVVVVDGPSVLNSQMAEPVMLLDTFLSLRKNQVDKHTWVYDFGQNASGIPQITVQGREGDTVKMYPAELLKQDGTANQRATGSPYYFEYILKGDGPETWKPRFSYYGFRYVQVYLAGRSNDSVMPSLVDIRFLHNRNSAAKIGAFNCSSELFNKTYSLVDWAIKSNMQSLFTDCPHREKLGWLEQAHLMWNSVCFNYDVINLYRKQIDDMLYSQTGEGLVPEIAPEYVKFQWGDGMFRDSPEWGSSLVIVPWYLYKWYGDKGVLLKSYSAMKRYLAYLEGKAKGYILSEGLGDWYDLGPKPPGVSQLTPMGVTGTAIFYYDLTILKQIAIILNEREDAKEFDKLSVKVKKAFNEKFFHKDTIEYATGSQTANAMAVYMNLVEPQYKQAVIDNIIKDVRSHSNSLTAGDIGYRYLLCVLHEAGRDDVIYDMNSRTDVPGYGYQLAKGATALTESWSALPTNSNNHFMLGHIMEWFYKGLGGIDQTEASVAYKKILLKPEPVGDVTDAETSFECPYGTIATKWKKHNGIFDLSIEVPANTSALVYLPSHSGSTIVEGGTPLTKSKDIKMIGKENGKIVLKIGSGPYHFVVKD